MGKSEDRRFGYGHRDNFESSTDVAVNVLNVTAIEQGADHVTGGPDDRTATANTAFGNRRQQSIFQHMWNQRADNVYWDWTLGGGAGGWTVTYAYLPHYYALDPSFKAMVDGYRVPAAGNLINSVRIQALSTALESANMATVRTAASNLDALDQSYLSNRTQSQPLWDQAARKLAPADYAEFEGLIASPMGPHQRAAVTVQPGDTLSGIAARYLGTASRWTEIHALNRAAVGRDPNRIEVGTVLTLPAQ